MLQRHDIPFSLETPEALLCTPRSARELRARVRPPLPEDGVGNGLQDLIDAIVLPEDLTSESFAKISLWGSPIRVEQLATEIGPEVGALPNSITDDVSSGELHLVSVDKADGVEIVADHLGMDHASTVGIGDGMNDLGMLRAARTAIAIEGASSAVLEAAGGNAVPGPLEHGIVTAFERLGMLRPHRPSPPVQAHQHQPHRGHQRARPEQDHALGHHRGLEAVLEDLDDRSQEHCLVDRVGHHGLDLLGQPPHCSSCHDPSQSREGQHGATVRGDHQGECRQAERGRARPRSPRG